MTADSLMELSDPDLRSERREPDLTFALERLQDEAAVDALIARAFGPGRFAKTAERLREGNRLRRDLSICAWAGDRLVGAVRQWPVLVGDTPGLFLGPFAVEAEYRSRGLGAALIRKACEAARAAGERFTLLVGPAHYFAPLGLEPAEGRVSLPGPVDPRRVLWRAHTPDGLAAVQGPARIPRGV